jgi:hypothetical protein
MKTSRCLTCFRTTGLAIALLVLSNVAWSSDASEKARINKARAEADATLAAQEAECRQRFVVNACLIEARQQHRAVVGPLKEELLVIEERRRKQRAAERAERIRAKAESAPSAGAAAASSVAAPAPSVASPRSAAPPLIRPRLRSSAPASEDPLADMPSAGPEPAAATSGVADVIAADPKRKSKRLTPMPDPNATKESADRAREIEARRESVLKRNAERAAKKAPSAPLPVPAAAGSQTR